MLSDEALLSVHAAWCRHRAHDYYQIVPTIQREFHRLDPQMSSWGTARRSATNIQHLIYIKMSGRILILLSISEGRSHSVQLRDHGGPWEWGRCCLSGCRCTTEDRSSCSSGMWCGTFRSCLRWGTRREAGWSRTRSSCCRWTRPTCARPSAQTAPGPTASSLARGLSTYLQRTDLAIHMRSSTYQNRFEKRCFICKSAKHLEELRLSYFATQWQLWRWMDEWF